MNHMTNKSSDATMEEIQATGNLSNLDPAQRLEYYNWTCESLGLDPLTKPFDYITLNGELRMCIKRDVMDQLRKIHGDVF